ncbi:MAG: regulatory protein RecX [Mariprofundales bacterium]
MTQSQKQKSQINNNPQQPKLLDSKGLYSRAIWLLTRQEYCSKQLDQKLRRVAADSTLVAPLITQLQQQGYLSEQRFAESYLRSRIQRGDSVKMAALKAGQKGVESGALREAVATIDIDEAAACRRLIHKRDPHNLRFDDRKLWQRHLRYLCNKGYPMNIAMQTMQQHDLEEERTA